MDIELFSIILLIHYQYFYQCFKTYVLNLKKDIMLFVFQSRIYACIITMQIVTDNL